MEGCGEQGGLHSRTLRSFPCREALHGAAPHAEGAGGRAGGDLLLQSLGDTRAQEVLLVSGCGQRGRGAPAASPLTASLPCRYQNGTLLDRTAHRYSSRLVLRALRPEQAGTYHCKASSEAGAIRSAPAQLTVLGERGLGCVGRPVLAGRPAAVAFVGWPFWLAECTGVGPPTLCGRPVAEASEQLLLLLLALGVLAVLSMVCLLVPGHP